MGAKYSVRSSEAAMGRGGAQRPVLHVNEPKKDGCAQRTGAHARPKPTSSVIPKFYYSRNQLMNKGEIENYVFRTYERYHMPTICTVC